MSRRGVLLSVLAIVSAVAAGIAGWGPVDWPLRGLPVVHIQMVDATRTPRGGTPESAPISVESSTSTDMAVLRADLAAARQRLSVAETAAKETEDRLAEEISRRADLEAKYKAATDELQAARKAVETAEAKAEKAVNELAKIEAVLPASRLVPRDLVAKPSEEAKPRPGTTASIGNSGDVKSDAQGGAGQGAPQAAAASGSETPPRTVRRRKKSKPKEEYFLDSLF